jgi:lysozyme family protein
MAIFDLAYEQMQRNEGGYTKDPHETICGIDRKYQPQWEGWRTVDAWKTKGKKPNDLLKDPAFMSSVKVFYRSNFWPAAYNLIASQSAANMLFDRGVNMGVQRAVMVCQGVIGATADGKFGKESLFKLNQMDGAEFCQEFDKACDAFYEKLAEKNPEKYGRFLKGWKARV